MLNPALLPLSYSISRTGPSTYTALEASLIVVGSLATAQVPANKRLAALSGSLWLFGGCIALIPLSSSLVQAAVPIAVSGIGSAAYAASIGATLLERADETARGTLMAVRFTLSKVMRVLGLGASAVSASLAGHRR